MLHFNIAVIKPKNKCQKLATKEFSNLSTLVNLIENNLYSDLFQAHICGTAYKCSVY